MKNNRELKWDKHIYPYLNVLYPYFVYFILLNTFTYIGGIVLAVTNQNAGKYYMLLQSICAVLIIPILSIFYKKDQSLQLLDPGGFSRRQKLLYGLQCLCCGVLSSIVLNNLISLTSLKQRSVGYMEASNNFYSGDTFFLILSACIFVPVMEELLYRGILYPRMQRLFGTSKAIVLSSLLFGISHFNLVQFIYAGILGIMLALFVEKTGHIYGAVFAHMGANFISVIRSRTKLFFWMEHNWVIYIVCTVLFSLFVIAILYREKKSAVYKKSNS